MKRILLFTVLSAFITVINAQTIQTPPPVAPYTPAVMANGTLYISGQIPRVPETGEMVRGDIRKATEQSMKNIGALLEKNGMDYEDLVMVNIYMTDMDNYQAINDVYKTFFKNQKFPARAAIQIGRLPLDAEVEISGIAVKRQ